MNGRMIYDPQLGRFLSADSIIQFPYNLQNYNRYSYVLNNPITYNDPTGHILPAIAAAVVWIAAPAPDDALWATLVFYLSAGMAAKETVDVLTEETENEFLPLPEPPSSDPNQQPPGQTNIPGELAIVASIYGGTQMTPAEQPLEDEKVNPDEEEGQKVNPMWEMKKN